MRLTVQRRTLRLAQPFEAAHGSLTERVLFAVSIADAQGAVGHGEAAPLPAYDGVDADRVELALERYARVLAVTEQTDVRALVDSCRRVDALPAALAAVDMALWDRAGRIAGQPVARLLCERPVASVRVNATVAALDRAGVAAQAAAAAHAGFTCVKVKVGVGDDAARVAAVRAAAGPSVALRLDANGAWSVEQAVRMIEALAPAGLELVEEPVHGLAETRAVRERVAARIAIDETAAHPGALGAGVADAVCLKVSRCGGIGGLIDAASAVRASGAEPYVASTIDGPLGIAAALHAAAALAAQGPLPHCGLATLGLFADLEDPLPAREGLIALPNVPGLGVEPL